MQIITDRAHNGLMTAMLELELLLLLPGSAAGDGSAGVGGGVSLVVLLVGALVSACSHATRLRSVTLCCLRCLLPAACCRCHSGPPGCGFAVVIKIFSVLFRFRLCIWHISLLSHCISFHFFSSSNFFQRLFNFHFHFGRHELCQLCRLRRTFC